MLIRTILVFIVITIGINKTFSQCTNGNQPECECETAPVLCTVDELDNYEFSMSSYQHPWDGPSPICPGANNTVSNNPTWFAFTAWCTDLTLTVHLSNCQYNNGNIGVQIAVFPDCSFTNPVACNVDVGDCGNTDDKTLVMTGLVIGDVYYFLVDGCSGSWCDIIIDVEGVCGEEEIEPWTNPVDGETEVCAGDSEGYTVDDLAGAGIFHWFIDGTEVDQTTDPTNTITWDTPGSYELCVDASNDPCVPITDDPPPNCITINVYEANAGTITITPNPLCPNEVANITVSGYSTDPEYAESIVVTDASGVIIQILTPPDATFTSDHCETYQICSYNYVIANGTPPVIGNNINDIDCDEECCDIECETVSFEDDEVPEFPNAPGNLTLTCADLIPAMEDQEWTDNCDGSGMVPGTETGSATLCDGGTLTRTWEYTDVCDNVGTHVQTITVEPTPPPAFDNPPGDETLDCDNIPTNGPDLNYTNNGQGACLVEGTITPEETGSADICGGTITYTWDFTDECGNNINHVQNITITPAPEPEFINPPADVTLDCDNIPTNGPDLDYTNNGSGACLIEGTISPAESGSADICGGTITYTWDFTDECGNNINHVQNVVIEPAPQAEFINPPPDVTVDCDNIPPTPPALDYTNNASGDCLHEGSVSPTQSGSADICGGDITFTWEFTDPCGNPIHHMQNVIVIPADAPEFINPPADVTLDCDNIPTNGPDLDYTNNGPGACLIEGTISPTESGSADICGGTITYTWDFTDECGNNINHVQNVVIEPAPEPEFINPPGDMTFDCDNIPTSGVDLDYTNNGTGACLFEGTISPVESGSADICGGTITYTWDFVDPCGNSINHVQNITIDPAPEPVFINPPADVTLDCENIPNSAPDLDYTNNGQGDCLFEGTISPTQSGSADLCGGIITFHWQYIDPCGNGIQHLQTITIEPAPEPEFINPPADITLDCDNIPSSGPDLDYTNNSSGNCLIEGTVSPTQSGSADICGGTITYTWSYTDVCGNTIHHAQNIEITPAPDIMFLNPPIDYTTSCDNVPGNPGPLDFTNNGTGNCLIEGTADPIMSGSYDECGGTISFTWEHTSECGQTITHVQNVNIEPAPQAQFVGNLPQAITVDCGSVPSLPPPLNYTNNASGQCLIEGSQNATQSGSYNECGGTIIFTWQFIDDCNRTITHTQNVTVEPAPEAAFTNLPGPITLDCSEVPPSPPPLNYTNNLTGPCQISGAVNGIQSGSYNSCGGTITYNWVFTDDCNRTISHSQVVTINASSDPHFTFFPPDVTINCDEDPPPLTNLPYTNDETGPCAITGSVAPTIIFIDDLTQEYYWTYTNPCNQFTIEHTQVISQNPTPEITIDPNQAVICEGEFFDLSTISVTDANNTNPVITYHFGTPATTNNQLQNPNVNPPQSITYYILGTNSFGCTDEAPFSLIVEEPPFAGLDGFGSVCYTNASNVNLFDFLLGNPLQFGQWLDNNNYGINVSNPYNVNFDGFPAGIYMFDYVMPSNGECPDDVATATVEILPEVEIEILSIACSGDPDFYEIVVNTNGYVIAPNQGTVTDLGNNQIIITDIPIDNSISIVAFDPLNTLCLITISVNPPNCDCPTVPPPTNNGNASICEGDVNPELSVTVGANETANWYSDAAGTNLLLGGSTTYTSEETLAGVYIYYTEAENLLDGCLSSILTPVQFTIFANPTGTDAQLEECDDDGDGFDIFNLTEAEDLISTNPAHSFTFYETLLDAQNGENPLSVNYTNIATPTQELFVVITNQQNCESIVSLTLVVNPLPSISLDIADEACLGDGNGSVTVTSPGGINYSLDNINWTTGTLFEDLASGSYTVYVESDNDCIASEDFDIAPGLQMELTSFDINCDDNGTASDANDDFYTITFTVNNSLNAPGTYTVNDGTGDLGTFNYGDAESITIPAMGQTLVLTFADDALGCSIEQTVGPLSSCSTDCTITINQLDYECSDNGTPSNPADDIYTISISASAINGSANNTYNVLIDGVLTYNYTYDIVSTFTLPANGGSPIILVVDNQDDQCQASQSIGPLVSCSDLCVISFTGLTSLCNDNGTVSNQADDFYEVTINASALNGSPTNNFIVLVDGTPSGTFVYGTGGTISIPADGGSPIITIVDETDDNCSAEQQIGPLDPCTDECTITATVSNIDCDNQGTENDSGDDTYTFDLFITGQNVSDGWVTDDANYSGNYGELLSLGPFLISDGNQVLVILDNDNPECTTQVTATAPPPCSAPCELDITQLDLFCNDNGTISILTDDFYEITINASATNGANNFIVLVDGVEADIFPYGTGGTITLPADGSSPTITVVDEIADYCTDEQQIGPLEVCNDPCDISATITNIECDDEGTTVDPDDDTYTFELVVTGVNTSAGWELDDQSASGNYGQVIVFGPFLISDGDQVLTILDSENPDCSFEITAVAPPTCSDECELNITLLTVFCNDNGTVSDQNDDFYEITINAAAINGGPNNNFDVLVDGMPSGNFAYGTGGTISIPADGSSPTITIVDESIATCSEQQQVGPLVPCTDECQINANITNILCNNQGTGNDSSDDTYTFNLFVTGQNTSTGWISDDGNFSGVYGVSQQLGPFLILNGNQFITILDSANPDCNLQITAIAPPPCSDCPQSADAGAGGTLDCDNTSVILTATSSEPGTYLWTGPNMFEETTLSVTATEPGTYYFTATYSNNCFIEDSVVVEINGVIPSVNAGPDQIITCDVTEVYLDGSLSSQGIDILYNWTDETGDTISQDIGVIVTSGGTYYLQLTDTSTGCISAIDAVEVIDSTALPIAIIYAEPQNILDCTVSSILLYTIDQENVSYTWGSSGGSSTVDQITISEPDTYTLLAVDTITGCENSDFIIIEDLQDYPFVNLNSPDTLSCYFPEIIIDASGSQTGVDVIYNWYDGSNNLIIGENGDTLLVNVEGFYYLQLIDTINGCENMDSVYVESLLDQIPTASIDQTGALDCNNSSLVLDGSASSPFNNLIFEWTTSNGNFISGEDTPNPEIDQAGVYILTVTDIISGCTNSESITISIDMDQPVVVILAPGFINCYNPQIEIDASNSTVIGNLSYSWISDPPGGISGGNNTLTPTIDQGGTYTLTITNLDNGCTDTGSIEVDEDTEIPAAVANVADQLDCITEEVQLNGNGSSTGSEYVYSWTGVGIVGGNTTLQPVVNQPGNYTLTVLNTQNGCLNTDEVIVIEITDIPVGMEAIVNSPVCYGERGSIEIIAIEGGEEPYIYSINDGETFFPFGFFNSLQPGDYSVLIQDANGCEYEEFFFIPSVPELIVNIDPEITILLGESDQIIAFVNIPDPMIDTIVWSPVEGLSCTNCLDPFVMPLDEIAYTVTVTDLDGCTASDQIILRVKKDRDVFIPNVFSPHNNDGINDEFMIFGNEKVIVKINSFQVFDRWGELVWEDFDFQPNDPSRSWDGKLKGEPMNPAVFVYWAEIEFIDGVKKLYKGDVTLMR